MAAGPRYDAALQLLDHQLIDPEGRLIGKVDDLELTATGGDLVVTAVLTGPGALGHRLGGRLGSWMVRIWRRLHPAEGPDPNRVDWADVVRIDSAVHLARRAEPLGLEGAERWLRDRFTRHIPGAGDG
jgi:sporulation protein YlmC with PRC-barrel domain